MKNEPTGMRPVPFVSTQLGKISIFDYHFSGQLTVLQKTGARNSRAGFSKKHSRAVRGITGRHKPTKPRGPLYHPPRAAIYAALPCPLLSGKMLEIVIK
jgi:hypothetical protein